MSFHKPLPIKLSPRARQDFVDILRYTGETRGTEQLAVYQDKIDKALQMIGHNPQLGHRREDLPPPHLAYPVGSHVIIYRIFEDYLGVVRILHQRMGLARRL